MLNLKGLRVLNTRPLLQNATLNQAIHDAGGIAIECPLLAIEPLLEVTSGSDNGRACHWIDKFRNLSVIHHAIFISTNAVQYFFDGLAVYHLFLPSNTLVSAIGAASARALNQLGVPVDFVPSVADSEHLLQLESMQTVQNQIIVLVKGEDGRTLIADTLAQRGALIVPIEVYRRVPSDVSQVDVQSLWRDDAVDIIVFTSEAAMRHLFFLLGEHAHSWLQGKPCLVISERLANVATQLGIKKVWVSCRENSVETLLRMK